MISNFIPRAYQTSIFKTSNEYNTLVVLPTGLGKTAIAMMLAARRLLTFPQSKVVFLAPTKPLAMQHLDSFKKSFLFSDDAYALFTGTVPPKKRKEFIDWMVRVEERNLQPDLVIFLDVHREQSDKNLNKRNLKEGRKNKNDIHEGDMSYMDKVRQMYLEYGNANGWVILDCMDHHTKEMKGILEIQEMIIDTIKTLHSS